MNHPVIPERLAEGLVDSALSPAPSSSPTIPALVATNCVVEASHRMISGCTVLHRYEGVTVTWIDAGLLLSNGTFRSSPSSDAAIETGSEVFIPYGSVLRVLRTPAPCGTCSICLSVIDEIDDQCVGCGHSAIVSGHCEYCGHDQWIHSEDGDLFAEHRRDRLAQEQLRRCPRGRLAAMITLPVDDEIDLTFGGQP